MKNLYYLMIIFTFTTFNTSAVELSSCALKYQDTDAYLDQVMEEVYHSIVKLYDKHGGKLKFGEQRFPFRFTYELNEYNQAFHKAMQKKIEIKKEGNLFRNGLQGYLERLHELYKSFPGELNNRIPTFTNKDQITFFFNSSLPYNQYFSIYTNMENLREFIKQILESPFQTKAGTYDIESLVIDDTIFKHDIQFGYETGWVHQGHQPDSWFEGPDHHLVMQRNKAGVSHQEIADELNTILKHKEEYQNRWWNLEAKDITAFVKYEHIKTKKFREVGISYFKNDKGQQRVNFEMIRRILKPLIEAKASKTEMIEALNKATLTYPYNQYIDVPWTLDDLEKALKSPRVSGDSFF